MKTFLGKSVKTYTNSWTVVEGSVKKINAKLAKQVDCIEVRTSKYNSEELYATIKLIGGGVVSFTIDRKCSLQDGDFVDPTSVMVYQLTNGEKTIERMFGKAL